MKPRRAFLENKINQLIQVSNKNTPHFDYKVNFEEGTITLDVYTFNPQQRALHFLHSVTEQTPILCLTQMIIYLEEHGNLKKESSSYTITWKLKSESKSHQSYYYVQSEEEALEKFFFNKDIDEYEWDIKLNPMS